MDWLAALDFERATSNVIPEFYGDWYRDPWNWAELRWVAQAQPHELIVPRLDNPAPSRPALVDVPKENFGIRPAVVLDPIDRLIYQALVDRFLPDLHNDLASFAYGWRLARCEGAGRGQYAKNQFEWRNFQSALAKASERHEAALKTDIVSFFASIPPARMVEWIQDKVASSAITDLLSTYILQWGQIPARSGLVQRSQASSALANSYLRAADETLILHGKRGSGDGGQVSAARWMDDLWLFGDDEGRLREAQVALARVLRDLNLHLNAAKTDVLVGWDLLENVHQLRVAGLDYVLSQSEGEIPDEAEETIQAMLEEIRSKPERASRTEMKFLALRVREYQRIDFAEALLDPSIRMPHVADVMSRVYRDLGMTSSLQDWFLEYAASPWGHMEWSVGQWATMFPSDVSPDPQLISYLAERLIAGCELPLMAVAAQRLSMWGRDSAREVFHEVMPTTEHPLERRILALAGHGAGAGKTWTRNALGEFRENRVTLAYLEDQNWRHPPVPKDFG